MVNEYFEQLTYGRTLDYYIFELANFSIFGLILLLLYRLNFINSNSLIAWLGIFLSPLLFNYLLFSPYLFPDQFEYAREAISVKANGTSWADIFFYSNNNFNLSTENFAPISTVVFSSKILSTIPLLNYMTVTSLAFANKAILFITFLWFKRFFNNENEILLYFLIPSILLYSSLAIRDTLIIVISIFFIINLIRGKIIWSILALIPLFILKIQMFAILLIYLVGYAIFQAHRSKNFFIFFIFIFLISGLILEDLILLILDRYRLAFIAEDFVGVDGAISYQGWDLYGGGEESVPELSSIFSAIFLGLLNLPILLLIPMPWNWSGIFYPLQTIESIFLVYLYFNLSRNKGVLMDYQYIFLTFILIMGLSIYALLMANEGTFVRYRFTLFYPFLFGLLYLSSSDYQGSKKAYKED